MLHIRDAYTDALKILKKHAQVKGAVHFFIGNMEEAKGFWISVLCFLFPALLLSLMIMMKL